MKKLLCFFVFVCLIFSAFSSTEWFYYKHYPWVYDNVTKDWLYLRGGEDGKVFAYRASTKVWEEFSVPDNSGESFDTNNPPSNLTTALNSSTQLEMLWVEPGTFTMGSPTTEAGRRTDETEHNVTLTKGFYLGKYEVTQAQYEAVITGNADGLNAKPSNWPNNPNRPVEKVSWSDAQIFLTRLNAQQSANIPTGWSYVLPTEAEWEYACRAGTTTAYSWGNTIATSNANYYSSGLSQTSDAGNYAANPWGFHDMHGNVFEWCADWAAPYDTVSVTDPIGPASGLNRVFRGGSWYSVGTTLRSAGRLYGAPSHPNRSYLMGFRVSFQKVQ